MPFFFSFGLWPVLALLSEVLCVSYRGGCLQTLWIYTCVGEALSGPQSDLAVAGGCRACLHQCCARICGLLGPRTRFKTPIGEAGLQPSHLKCPCSTCAFPSHTRTAYASRTACHGTTHCASGQQGRVWHGMARRRLLRCGEPRETTISFFASLPAAALFVSS